MKLCEFGVENLISTVLIKATNNFVPYKDSISSYTVLTKTMLNSQTSVQEIQPTFHLRGCLFQGKVGETDAISLTPLRSGRLWGWGFLCYFWLLCLTPLAFGCSLMRSIKIWQKVKQGQYHLTLFWNKLTYCWHNVLPFHSTSLKFHLFSAGLDS